MPPKGASEGVAGLIPHGSRDDAGARDQPGVLEMGPGRELVRVGAAVRPDPVELPPGAVRTGQLEGRHGANLRPPGPVRREGLPDVIGPILFVDGRIGPILRIAQLVARFGQHHLEIRRVHPVAPQRVELEQVSIDGVAAAR